jgi:hypothetical protein
LHSLLRFQSAEAIIQLLDGPQYLLVRRTCRGSRRALLGGADLLGQFTPFSGCCYGRKRG